MKKCPDCGAECIEIKTSNKKKPRVLCYPHEVPIMTMGGQMFRGYLPHKMFCPKCISDSKERATPGITLLQWQCPCGHWLLKAHSCRECGAKYEGDTCDGTG